MSTRRGAERHERHAGRHRGKRRFRVQRSPRQRRGEGPPGRRGSGRYEPYIVCERRGVVGPRGRSHGRPPWAQLPRKRRSPSTACRSCCCSTRAISTWCDRVNSDEPAAPASGRRDRLDSRLRLGLRDARASLARGLTGRGGLRLRGRLDLRSVPAVAHLRDQHHRACERDRQRKQRKSFSVDGRTLVHAGTIRGDSTEFRDEARAAAHAEHEEKPIDGNEFRAARRRIDLVSACRAAPPGLRISIPTRSCRPRNLIRPGRAAMRRRAPRRH